ncbi:hypothetical protein [Ruminococcus flavefaciens]|uniref:Restriction endonuclease n=1 Tax=Ruminococcus flavefaciens TaxID=1265 RepID=A0A315XT82_RUMFL|nr:hypothetical protein [Ruminococcus flavefaciens]PWJ09965.1 hypothetical protein IE37_03259 [Ruminococcus flavefaciens]SSA52116.1 hypothetical protein SAMN02910325_03259 [Ruminococcus flavefaciens]
MYCSRLSNLSSLLDKEEIEKLDRYFQSLIGDAKNCITVSKIIRVLGISSQSACKVLTECKKNHILRVNFSVRCPECGLLIYKSANLSNIPEEILCYNCDNEFVTTPENIEFLYSLIDDSLDDSVFIIGQQNYVNTSGKSVAQENTMDRIFQAGGVNEYLFHPTDEQYIALSNLYSRVMNAEGKKEKGDTLENLTIKLFNLCNVFKAAGIRTTTNQIDCFVRNKICLNYGIFQTIGSRIYIECKNENKKPLGSYISKLHSLISITNASGKGECIKFGIIVSKKSAPSTFKSNAVKYYLAQKIIIISICANEIKQLIEQKGNLLELIERKATEIMLDSTTDLVKNGLYDI